MRNVAKRSTAGKAVRDGITEALEALRREYVALNDRITLLSDEDE